MGENEMGAVNPVRLGLREPGEGMVGDGLTEQMKEAGPFIKIDPNYECTCIEFTGSQAIEKFWELTCPCGVTDVYPLNGLPEVDTPHSCGNPKHWALKYKKE